MKSKFNNSESAEQADNNEYREQSKKGGYIYNQKKKEVAKKMAHKMSKKEAFIQSLKSGKSRPGGWYE